MCSVLHSLADIDEQTELQCLYLEKIEEYERLKIELSTQTKNKYMGIVQFGNDQFAPFVGYGDLVQGNITIKRVYYVKGLNHNLFLVGQFCDADLEVGGLVASNRRLISIVDLVLQHCFTDNRRSDLYTIFLQKASSPTPICFMAKASSTQAWLWHRRLSHLNFNTINLLSKKDIMNGKAKRSTFKTNIVLSSKGRFNLLHMDLCGPMRIKSINEKRHIVFLNKTLYTYFKEEGIEHQTSTPRTLKQNGVVERQNRTLVEAVRMMLSASKLLLFFWAKAIATTCYTQNRSLIIPIYKKTPYHIINNRKPLIKHLHIFCCTCYITPDGENLDKIKEKWAPCILVGYSTQLKGYRVYNKRTKLIVESIDINFDEIKELSKASDYDNSSPVPQLQKTSDHNSLELGIQDHINEHSSSKMVPN
ncbi:retrovirus-related pol polyprotein from transposon TNT 1-94, partial [Tanacetum coccineum]